MRNRSRAVLVVLALGLTFGCAITGLAQPRPNLGGYKEVPTDNPEVVAAAEFAVGEQGRKQESTIALVSIEKAESQVVAGVNYRLCMKVTVGDEDGESQDVKALVFRSLQKEYSLKSWEEESCGGSDSEENHNSSVGALKTSKSWAQLKNNHAHFQASGNLKAMVADAPASYFKHKQIDDGLRTPTAESAEYKAILAAVFEEYKEGDDHPTQFKVNYLKVHKGWAWINVTPLDGSGNQLGDEAPLLFQLDNGKWVSRELNDVGLKGDEHEGPHDPGPKYIKALQKKYPGMPLDIIPKRHA